MTRPGTHRWFTLAPAQRRNGNSWERLSLPVAIFVVFAFCAAAAIAAPAQSVVVFTTLASFDGPDGAGPYLMSLVQGSDGNFYGTTGWGGASSNCPDGCGTVFKMTPAGALTLLYSFCVQSGCPDGNYPYAGLVQGHDGDFYGTTESGGSYLDCPLYGQSGCGTVFKITREGALTTLYSFCSGGFPCADGANPWDALIQATDGNFYGTTSGGLSASTVFKIAPGGTLTTLDTFNGADGSQPYASLVQATDGNFYGTAHWGGAYHYSPCPPEGCGTVFRITPTGTLTALYSFCPQEGCPDGAEPYGGLVQGRDGNFYGTTTVGGNAGCNGVGCGTVFKISPTGTLTTLYRFCAQVNCTDGATPNAGLVQGRDGNFYGTTIIGGSSGCGYAGCGTVFEITQAGSLITLHSFGGADGAFPYGGLMQAPNGLFYGTTGGGGAYGNGAVFSMLVVPKCAKCLP